MTDFEVRLDGYTEEEMLGLYEDFQCYLIPRFAGTGVEWALRIAAVEVEGQHGTKIKGHEVVVNMGLPENYVMVLDVHDVELVKVEFFAYIQGWKQANERYTRIKE